jgi:hypothetical protein
VDRCGRRCDGAVGGGQRTARRRSRRRSRRCRAAWLPPCVNGLRGLHEVPLRYSIVLSKAFVSPRSRFSCSALVEEWFAYAASVPLLWW